MAITSAGALHFNSGTGATTASLTSTAVGDIFLFVVTVNFQTVNITGISGGNANWITVVPNWQSTHGNSMAMFMGTQTSVGTATATITFSGSVSAMYMEYIAMSFHSDLARPNWSIDKINTISSSSTSTAVSLPSLTPTGTGELYWCYMMGNNSTMANGSTPGCTYTVDTDSNMAVYDLNTSATLSPTCTQSPAAVYNGIAALIYETPLDTSTYRPLRVPNKRVGPMALRHAFRSPESPANAGGAQGRQSSFFPFFP